MEKITRSQFIQKYGFDPHDPASFTQKAPTTGAIGGSTDTAPKQTLTPEEVTAAMSSQPPQTLSADEVAKISGGASDSGYQPGKFLQSMKNFRPDYSGGTLNDISEGIGDVSVGVAKGLIRTPVNIAQALTPDAMWGENSLLNSDSERAKAFASATKGKTGLQKAGATAFDVATLFNPFSAEATVGGLAARGGGKFAQLATRGIDVAAENPSLLQKGAGLFQKVVPAVADSVVSGAVVGKGGDNVVSDSLIGAAFPTAKFAYQELKGVAGSQFAKSAIAAIKDSVTGGTAARDKVAAEVLDYVKTAGKEGIESQAKGMVDNRGTFSKLLKIFKGNQFGYGTKADEAFNEASDLISQRYMPHADIVDGSLDLTKPHDLLQADKITEGKMLSDSKKLFSDAKVKSNIIKSSFRTTMQNSGMNKTTDAYKSIENYVMKRIDDLSAANGGHLTANDIDGIRHDLGVQMGKLDDGEGTLLGMYKQAYKVFAKNVEKAGINAGKKDAVDLYRKSNARYSKLLDSEAMMQKISRMKTNPYGLTQQQRHGLQLLAGSVGGVGGGSIMTGGVSYMASVPLTKMLSDYMGKAKLYSMKIDPVMDALKKVENAKIAEDAKSLSELIAKQSKK